MSKMINLGGSVDCGAIVSENFWQHFWQKTFSAESQSLQSSRIDGARASAIKKSMSRSTVKLPEWLRISDRGRITSET